MKSWNYNFKDNKKCHFIRNWL